MIVSINASVFNNSLNNSDLNDLMHFFKKGKHRINLKKAEDFSAFENSDWTKTLIKSDVDLLKESIGSIDKKEIIISDSSKEDEFNLKEAFYYLDQSIKIILEQIEYETPFILKIIQEFDTTGKLIKALQKGWLEFYNGAGSNSESIIREKLTRNIATNQYFIKPLIKYLRFYEIKDSDREYCTINLDGTVTQQVLPDSKTKFLEDNKIPYHILYKREKENYMPDSIFNGLIHYQDKKKFVQVYLRLSPHQKDFFDIEKGFSEKDTANNGRKIKDRTSLNVNIQNLYSNLTAEQYRNLGFGISYPNFKSEFSKNFEKVSKIDLEKRIQHQQPLLKSKVNPSDTTERNEFEHIIHEIKYLL